MKNKKNEILFKKSERTFSKGITYLHGYLHERDQLSKIELQRSISWNPAPKHFYFI